MSGGGYRGKGREKGGGRMKGRGGLGRVKLYGRERMEREQGERRGARAEGRGDSGDEWEGEGYGGFMIIFNREANLTYLYGLYKAARYLSKNSSSLLRDTTVCMFDRVSSAAWEEKIRVL